RVYAEDSMSGFTPDIGTLTRYRVPSGRNIRVDDAFEEGMDIPIYYDPMIAKLVVWGEDREKAISRTIEAIDDYQISGLKTTLDFGKYVLSHEAFVSGNFDTNFVKHYFQNPKVMHEAMEEEEDALIHSINTIWTDIKDRDKEEYASREIQGSWRTKRS
ncbi:MAG: biotin carboxylase, partial [Crocinitomicaceae bacterium]